MNLARLVESFTGIRATVVGDAMLDRYVDGTTDRLSAEAPVPVVQQRESTDLPGGAANVAANLRALGAEVKLVSLVGADECGRRLLDLMDGAGVDTSTVVEVEGRTTLSKTRICAAGHMLVRVDEGTTLPPGERGIQRLIEELHRACSQSEVLVVSDYGYGTLPDAVVGSMLGCREEQAILVVDSKKLPVYRGARPAAVKPNFRQAAEILGRSPEPGERREEFIARSGDALLDATGATLAAVSLDADGALFVERGKPHYRTFARPAPEGSACGAGDTFTGALALALAAGADTPAAAELASSASAVVVGARRTAPCSQDDLLARLAEHRKFFVERDRLRARIDLLRKEGRRIVLTNGCFDLLHRGHVTYLNRAKSLGDVLVVALNSDAGVARLKGPGRPINSLNDRLHVLAGLSSVDIVTAFDEDTASEIVADLRPDVFVKGGDYARKVLPEAEVIEGYGGRVEIVDFVEDRSTTSVVERIKAGTVPSRVA